MVELYIEFILLPAALEEYIGPIVCIFTIFFTVPVSFCAAFKLFLF